MERAERIEMGQRERDVLKVMSLVLEGRRTQAEAARLLRRSVRQVRRLQRRLESRGDGAVVHGLRGRPSNRRLDDGVRARALSLYRAHYGDFGPTLACEKLASEHGLEVSAETLRQWLLAAGLWHRKRRRDRHRARRARRSCFGEMLQADASHHDWLEGRGPRLTLVGVIDDATGKALLRFFEAETAEAYMDVLGRWIGKHGRPVSWYCDRHGAFYAERRPVGNDASVQVPTQFSRALNELDIRLILANSPQAKGRVERLWGTCQDRLVKELRLAEAATIGQANKVLTRAFVPWFNRRCVVKPASGNDAHRPLAQRQDLAAVLCHQETRAVANDYTVRVGNVAYQLLPPAWPGLRGGTVIVERRVDGSLKVRFKQKYLPFAVAARQDAGGGADSNASGAPPPGPRSLAHEPIPAEEAKGRVVLTARPSAVHRTAGRSGRTPAEPCTPGGGSCGRGKSA
jgi:hypothetical protein